MSCCDFYLRNLHSFPFCATSFGPSIALSLSSRRDAPYDIYIPSPPSIISCMAELGSAITITPRWIYNLTAGDPFSILSLVVGDVLLCLMLHWFSQPATPRLEHTLDSLSGC